MNTNSTNSTVTDSKGTDPVLADAAGKLARKEATTFGDLVKLAIALADADAASKLPASERGAYIGGLTFGTKVGGRDVKMTAATYSKRVKVGRMAMAFAVDAKGTTLEVTNLALFTDRCDAPSMDKFYEWLPKNAAMTAGRAAAKASKADKADDTAGDVADVKVKVAPVEVIMGLLPHLTAADLDRVAAEIVRRRTPVATPKAA